MLRGCSLKFPVRMKLPVIFLIAGMLLVNAVAFAQQVTYVKKKVLLRDLFDEINKQTGYDIIWSEKQLNHLRPIDVDFHHTPLEKVLDICLKGQALKYTIKDKRIIIQEQTPGTNGPSGVIKVIDVKGMVVDEERKPLSGATIKVKENNNGTVTDVDGVFLLKDIEEKSQLMISFLGYISQTINVSPENMMVKLVAKGNELENVVISVGYGMQKKTSITGAVSSVNGKDIAATPTTNLSRLLAGRLPGAQIVSNSGLVGAGADILVRGPGSGTGGTFPLVVIDNVVSSRADFDVLDPNEVEVLTLLKDAGTAGVYGSRASNGVLLVTTRSGSYNQKPVFTFKSYFSTDRTTEPIQGYSATDQLIFKNNQYKNSMLLAGNPVGQLPYGPDAFAYYKDRSYDLMDYIWQNPAAQQYNLSVSGGGENLTYFLMGGVNKSNSSFKDTDYNRYNFRSKLESQITTNLKVGLNISGYRRNADRFYWPYDTEESNTIPDFYRSTFNWSRLNPFYTRADGTPADRTDPLAYPVSAGSWNPVELIHNGGYRKIVYNNFNGIFNLDLKIPFVKGLSTGMLANYNYNTRNGKALVKFNKFYKLQFKPAEGNSPGYIPAPINFELKGEHNLRNDSERIVENVDLSNSYQLNWFLNYARKFGRHELSADVIYEQSNRTTKSLTGTAGKLVSGESDQILAASKDFANRYFDGSEGASARMGWVGRLHYEYDDRYIAEFAFREDGSYVFGPEKRFGLFPSVSAAWRISKEKFFGVSFINELKIRGSIGTTGNDGTVDNSIAPYQWQSNYNIGRSYIFGTDYQIGIAPGLLPNPDITWEKTTSYNGGLDFGMFDGKLNGSVDYFERRISNIFGNRIASLPGILGATLPAVNYAKKEVSGFEVALQYRQVSGAFKYAVGGNLGYAKDKWVLRDENPAMTGTWRSAIGQPDDRIYGYVSEGIIRDQGTIDALKAKGFKQFGRDPMLGALLFKDIRGANFAEGPDGRIDENDATYLSSNAIPRINYGINLSGEWKNFKLDILLQGVGAYDKIISTLNTPRGGVFQVADRPYFGLWTDAWSTENPNGKYPKVIDWGYEELGFGASSFWIRNGSYLRVRSVNLSYAISGNWLTKVGLQKMEIFFTGTNLLTLTAFKAYDPEQFSLDSYPVMKTYTAGLNINF